MKAVPKKTFHPFDVWPPPDKPDGEKAKPSARPRNASYREEQPPDPVEPVYDAENPEGDGYPPADEKNPK